MVGRSGEGSFCLADLLLLAKTLYVTLQVGLRHRVPSAHAHVSHISAALAGKSFLRHYLLISLTAL